MTRAPVTPAPAPSHVVDLQAGDRERRELADLARALSRRLLDREWQRVRERYRYCPYCGRPT
jgi:hypothetical protein